MGNISRIFIPARPAERVIRVYDARRGEPIAAVVTARKLAVLVWHLLTKEEDFLWARPSLNETKRRTQELKAEMPAAKGQCEHAYPDR